MGASPVSETAISSMYTKVSTKERLKRLGASVLGENAKTQFKTQNIAKYSPSVKRQFS